MLKSELKSIIMECIEEMELMNEGGGARRKKRLNRGTTERYRVGFERFGKPRRKNTPFALKNDDTGEDDNYIIKNDLVMHRIGKAKK